MKTFFTKNLLRILIYKCTAILMLGSIQANASNTFVQRNCEKIPWSHPKDRRIDCIAMQASQKKELDVFSADANKKTYALDRFQNQDVITLKLNLVKRADGKPDEIQESTVTIKGAPALPDYGSNSLFMTAMTIDSNTWNTAIVVQSFLPNFGIIVNDKLIQLPDEYMRASAAVLVFNPEGELIQTSTFSTTSCGAWTDLEFDSSSNLYIVSNALEDQPMIQKLDSSGNLVWKKTTAYAHGGYIQSFYTNDNQELVLVFTQVHGPVWLLDGSSVAMGKYDCIVRMIYSTETGDTKKVEAF